MKISTLSTDKLRAMAARAKSDDLLLVSILFISEKESHSQRARVDAALGINKRERHSLMQAYVEEAQRKTLLMQAPAGSA